MGICLSFHAMMMGQHGVPSADGELIVAVGTPSDERLKGLVTATKYALAHKGIILPREKQHLEIMGFGEDKMVEMTYLAGQMSAFNMLYVHLINEGVAVEDMLKEVGPFKNTVYASAKKEL